MLLRNNSKQRCETVNMVRRIATIATLCAISLLVCGCATEETHSVTRVALPPVAHGQCRIFFYRIPLRGLKTLKPDILVDNNPVGASREGYFYVDLPPGRHSVTCSRAVDPGRVGTSLYQLGAGIIITIKEKESRYVKFEPFHPGYFSDLRMVVVHPEQASQDILQLPYIGR
jgi:hypothetical protein